MSAKDRVVLVAQGSAGDVHPFVGLGMALASRGHAVTLIANSLFQGLAERQGLSFLAMGSIEEYEAALKDPALWDPDLGFATVMRAGPLRCLGPLYDMVSGFDPETTVLGYSLLSFGARLAHEKWGFAGASVHLQPSCLRSFSDTPVARLGMESLPRWPAFAKRALYWFADRRVIDPIIAPEVNAFRRRIGLSPVKRLFKEWIHSPDMVIGLFPDFFAPPQPDWPHNTRVTGFSYYDDALAKPLDARALDFIQAGEPPIVFTAGSAQIHGQAFFQAATEALALLRRRGVFVTSYAEQLPMPLPPGCIHLPYAPFSELFPRAAAVVHHGGIGTTAQCLAAGAPQLICPSSHDQPDNAARIARLGAGAMLPPKRFTGTAVAKALAGLLDQPAVAATCRTLAARIDRNAPVVEAARLIGEELRGAHSRRARR